MWVWSPGTARGTVGRAAIAAAAPCCTGAGRLSLPGGPIWSGWREARFAHAVHSSVVSGPAAEREGPRPPWVGPARLAGTDAAPVGPARLGSKNQLSIVQWGREHCAHTANRTEHPGLNEIEPVLLVSVAGPARRPIPELSCFVGTVASLRGGGHDSCLTSKHCIDGVKNPATRMLVHSIKGGLGSNATRGHIPGHLPDIWDAAGTRLVKRAQNGTGEGGPTNLHHSHIRRAGNPGSIILNIRHELAEEGVCLCRSNRHVVVGPARLLRVVLVGEALELGTLGLDTGGHAGHHISSHVAAIELASQAHKDQDH
eukprot:2480496-Amphidinium_carterae.1